MKETVVIVSEREHLLLLDDVLKRESGHVRVVALDARIELLLESSSIAFESASSLRTTPTVERLEAAERIGREVLQEYFDFLSYRGVDIAKLFVIELQDHISRFIYYLDIAATLVEQGPIEKIVVLKTAREVPVLGRTLARFEIQVVADAFALVAESRGIDFEMVEIPQAEKVRDTFKSNAYLFRRAIFGLIIGAYNSLIPLLRPRKKVRILASETWKNIGSLMHELADSELILLDREEVRNITWRDVWRHRMRFIHMDDYVSRSDAASVRVVAIAEQKRSVRMDQQHIEQRFRGFTLSPHLEAVLRQLISEGVRRAVRNIEGAFRTVEKLRPDVIILRASVSAQIHFPILAHVGRMMNIPVIEQQHGLRYLGRGSFEKTYPAEYLATYGPLASTALRGTGHEPDKVIDIGSPRFDQLVRKDVGFDTSVSPDHMRIACIIPEISPGVWNDSYDVVNYLKDVAAVARTVPRAYFILRVRPDTQFSEFFKDVIRAYFPQDRYTISDKNSILSVFKESDIVVSYYSTVVLESLIFGLPTVFLASQPMQAIFAEEFASHESAGALAVARSSKELAEYALSLMPGNHARARIVESAHEFIRREYLFDGHASERFAQLIRTLARRSS